MNSLSWLIYAGDVAGNLQAFLSFVAIGSCLAGATVLVGGAVEDCRQAKTAGRWTLAIGILAAFAATALPSRQTLYMIAASEMGEKVVTTPEAKEMLGDLREVIAKQIKTLKEGK